MVPRGNTGRLMDNRLESDRQLLPRVTRELDVPRGRLDGVADANQSIDQYKVGGTENSFSDSL